MLNKTETFKNDVRDIKGQVAKMTYSLEVTPTRKCNMACTYCFEAVDVAQHQTDFDNADDYLAHIIEKIEYLLDHKEFREIYDGIHLGFWGGEPTMNPTFFDTIMRKFCSNDAMSFHIYTNGYSLSPIQPTLDWMKENNYQNRITVQVSYDGEPVNSKNRVLVNGKTTGHKALDTLESLITQGFKMVNIKATLSSPDLKHLSEVWSSFEELYYKFKKYGVNILYAPTVDYTKDIGGVYAQDFKDQMKLIAKKEVAFFKKENQHLMTWFELDKSICNAGATMGAVDIDGNLYVCHGALYSEEKTNLIIANVKDQNPDFVDAILSRRADITTSHENNNLPDKCIGCEATYCANCNVEQFTTEDKEKLINKDEWNKIWFARNQRDEACNIYKYFGKIKVAVDYLKKEK